MNFRTFLRRGASCVALPALLAIAAAPSSAQLGVWPQPEPQSDPYNPPPAHTTPSVSNSARIISRPAGANVNVPPGFEAMVFASGLGGPRNMLLMPNGDIFVTESRAGRVAVLRDEDGDGKAEFKKTFLSDLDSPFGIDLRDGYLYIAEEVRVIRVPYTPGDTEPSAEPETVIRGIPRGGHWTRNIIFSPDGSKMYLAVGSTGNVSDTDPPICAAITEYSDNFQDSRIFASGLRNPVGLAWEPVKGELWTVVNERDGLGDNTPPDYATSVKEGGFYGWPYAYLGGIPDPDFGDKKPELVEATIFPDVPIQAHSAPLGLAFNTKNLFPVDYKNGLFIANHGSWNRSNPVGYNVLFQQMKDGEPVGRALVFANGWLNEEGNAWGRPVSVTFAADGALLVSDDGGNRIWRIAPKRAVPGSLGDVNEDSTVNVQDVTLVLRAVVGLNSLSPVQTHAADMHPVGNPDGKITVADVIVLLRKVVGNPISEEPSPG